MGTAGLVRYAITRPGPVIGADEPLDPAVRRIAVSLTAGAIADLRTAGDVDAAVHAARKKLKRARAIIRLVRDGTGRTPYREINVVLRDSGRRLGAARDAAVLCATLDDLIAEHRELLAPDPFADTVAFLAERHRTAVLLLDRQIISECITALGTARLRIGMYAGWRAPEAFSAIEPGIRRVYRRGMHGFRRAAHSRATPHLHEWRKRVKYLRYQMEALSDLNRPLIGAEAATLDRLGETLGIDHDLSMLASAVAAEPQACRDERERWLLVALAFAARTARQQDAFRMGAALYAERPRAFTDRIGGSWEASGRALTA